MSDEKLLRTPLYSAHVAAKAKLVPFAGWEMPVQYTGVVDEHQAVRKDVGLFDVSHMGEVEFRGPKALETVNRIISNDLSKIADSQAVYTVMCRPDGGIVDDLVVYRFNAERVFICVNAGNRQKDFEWMKAEAKGACDVVNLSDEYAQIAVQGPKAAELVQRLTKASLGEVKKYWFTTGQVAGKEAIIARTGYTGEDGFELYLKSDDGVAIWNALLESGKDLGVKPAGLGARDSLRLEMCFPLYGNDIDDTTNPLEAGLGWVVKLGKSEFNGKAALEKIKAAGLPRKLTAFAMTGRGIGRHGYPIAKDGKNVGVVTSGTMGPSIDKAVGLAYVPTEISTVGSTFDVMIRDKPVAAVVVERPFLKR
jgi:aminomethyltransferase